MTSTARPAPGVPPARGRRLIRPARILLTTPARILLTTPARILLTTIAVAALVTGLAACGRSTAESGASSRFAGPTPASEKQLAAGGADAAAGSGAAAAPSASSGAGAPAGSSPADSPARLIRTAQLTLEVTGPLNVSAARIRTVAGQFGGHVESETTGYSASAEQKSGSGQDMVSPPGESLIVLRIPEPKLDDAIAAVTGLSGGKVVSQTSSSRDVTGDIADLTSRVASQRASLGRVRALMDRATSLQDVVALEAELSRRQSDLEALQARLATVSDQADLSTLTVLLRTPPAVARDEPAQTGFLPGLETGWRGLKVLTTTVLTVAGALLPFLAVALVLGWPVRLLLARTRRRTPPARALRPYGPHTGPGPSGPPAPPSMPVAPVAPVDGAPDATAGATGPSGTELGAGTAAGS